MAELVPVLIPLKGVFDSSLEHNVHDWNKKFLCKTLSGTDFRQFWAKYVPFIFCPKSDAVSAFFKYDEDMAIKVLFEPLEQFICGTKETVQMFEHLKALNKTSSLCGKVFKSGEPTYSCRDCGLDPTCVLCADCFTNGAHRFHRYKMSASSGGGYCDCGDEEAWKKYGSCDIHSQNKSMGEEEESPLDKLPSDLVERLRIVMSVVLNYCHAMLTLGHEINLPADLQYPTEDPEKNELPDTYCTMVFNDEIHTYDQVIETLSKAISCSKKTATDYATLVDREGRTIVMCNTFAVCNQVRHVIERITSRQASKLKVSVMHRDVVAHQTFASRLLLWLQKIVTLNKGFCHIFTDSIMEGRLLEAIMLADSQLWKSARNHWHQLFICGMLMDPKCKKSFAKCFTSIYPSLMKDYSADDHAHSLSIVSLAVQIYTVPTLAHQLIQEENAIYEILRAFLTECDRIKNEDGKLAFMRNQNYTGFRRAQHMLYDVDYLISIPPAEWNDNLRRCFINGIKPFFQLLAMMQGMDSVKRQEGQHVEYEAEWESGVNLQLKVASASSSLLKWAGSDYVVFVKTFRSSLKHFQRSQTETNFIGIELANHSASCIQYDVAKMPVTIHLPLVRFIAGLILYFEKFSLSYDSSQFVLKNVDKPSPVQLMEHSLRTLVMLAQFHAGMWRRNGYSLLNQLYFYHNVRLRTEMYDRDILMLQVACSMIESNEFLIHLVYKFGLLNWSDESYDGTKLKPEDDNIRQVLAVAEEFLGLILILVSERFTPGLGNVTETDKIKKEIVQLLCIEPMPHSKLFKLLPKDHTEENTMERILTEVAVFKKLKVTGTGKYELKPEYHKWFNPFYYHYTREDQSKAEETQVKRKKQNCEELCCLPPVPPEFIPRYSIIINVLQCDVMLHIMELVLKRTCNLHSAAFSEAQLEKVLHLVGVALHDEERITLKEMENSFFCFTSRANKKNFVSLLEDCLKSPRVELCGEPLKDLLNWVIKKYKEVEALHIRTKDELSDASTSAAAASTSEPTQDRKRKAEVAAARRARIMAQMSAMQKSFIKEHAELFKETNIEESSTLSQSEMDIYTELQTEDPSCFQRDPQWKSAPPKVYTCILCREDQELTSNGPPLVLSAFVQRSTILSKNRKHKMTKPDLFEQLHLPADLFLAPHISTCGHVMHSECWEKFFESVQWREQRRPLRFGRHTSFDVDKNEFLCPLCERLSNTIIPIIPPLSNLLPPSSTNETAEISLDDWLSTLKKIADGVYSNADEDLDYLVPDNDPSHSGIRFTERHVDSISQELPEEIRVQFKELFACFEPSKPAACEEPPQEPFSPTLKRMMQLFSEATYKVGFSTTTFNAKDDRIPSMTWWASTYTIHSLEWLLRAKSKPLFGAHSARNACCLEAIVRFCGASLLIFNHSHILSDCVQILRYFLSDCPAKSKDSPFCLSMDAFSVLVFLTLSMPVLFNKPCGAQPLLHPLGVGGAEHFHLMLNPKHLLHLMLVFHFVQVLLTYPFSEEAGMETDEPSEEAEDSKVDSENESAQLFYEQVRTAAGLGGNASCPTPSGHTVVHCLKTGSLPFLRCAAMFFHVLTDTPPPTLLQNVDDNEFENICKFLSLSPSINELLASSSLKHLALSWASHPLVRSLLLKSEPDSQECLVRYPLSINQLVPLPNDYSELINSVSTFTCPNIEGDESRNPTMCLVCGEILCSQDYCCQMELNGSYVGACTYHAYYCGSGIGIFLRIRDCKVLLLSDKSKGCYTSPPYVDDYGETDQGLVRGNPLHLCPERYKELHELWLSHNIPEYVSHSMEQSVSLANWPML